MKSTRPSSFLIILTLSALLASMFASIGFVTPARAEAITVTTGEDLIEDTGDCSLREAIIAANTDTASGIKDGECAAGFGADLIALSAETYALTMEAGGPMGISAPVDIIGVGASDTIIQSANGTGILYISGAAVQISALTMMNGAGVNGGAILSNNYTELTISNSTFSNNSATIDGGAIFNSYGGVLTIVDSTFSGNSSGGNGGGAIYNYSGTLDIHNSTFSGNSATGNGGGGAIFNSAVMMLTKSTFAGNSARNGGGILNSEFATLTIKDSTLSGNTASNGNYGRGGGITNQGVLTISNSTLSGNSAGGDWGGGGGISHYGFAVLTITNSTLSGNSATYGGGLLVDGPLNYANTIIANSPVGGDCFRSGGSVIKTHNLVEDGSCFATFSGDPLLGPLDSNGGPTRTQALLTGSPAIDAGDDAVCTTIPINNRDQRGFTRQWGAHCDIGAYEMVGAGALMVSTIQRVNSGLAYLPSENFIVTFTAAVTGVDVSDFALATTGITGASVSAVSEAGSAFAAPAASSAYTVTVNTGSGTGTLRLDVLDDDTILDAALNPLGGAGAGNGGYTSGATYNVRFYLIFLPLSVR